MPITSNVNGAYRASTPYVNVNGVWRDTDLDSNINGSWREVYRNEIKESEIAGIHVIGGLYGNWEGVQRTRGSQSSSTSSLTSYWTSVYEEAEGENFAPVYQISIFVRTTDNTLYQIALNDTTFEWSSEYAGVPYKVTHRMNNRVIRMTGQVGLSWNTSGSSWYAWTWGYGFNDGGLTTSPSMPANRYISNQIIWPVSQRPSTYRFALMGGYFEYGGRQMTLTVSGCSFTVDGVSKPVSYQWAPGQLW